MKASLAQLEVLFSSELPPYMTYVYFPHFNLYSSPLFSPVTFPTKGEVARVQGHDFSGH